MMADEQRYEAMYRRHFSRVFRYLKSQIGHDADAQDLAQETFQRVYENFGDYRGEAEWSYLQTIARRVMLNWIRGRQTLRRGAETLPIDDEAVVPRLPVSEQPDYAELEQKALRRRRVVQAVEELGEAQREVLRLWTRGFKYKEIATVLRISDDAVKSRLRDAKRHLRARLGEDALPEKNDDHE